ncbi:hypothetical protein BGZ96_004316, partial [Linnemannia gamsii]
MALPHAGQAKTGSGKKSRASPRAASGSPSAVSSLLKSQSAERRPSMTRSSKEVQAENNEWNSVVVAQPSKFPSPRPSDVKSVSPTPSTKTSTSGTASPTADPAVRFKKRKGLVSPEPLYIYTDSKRNTTTTFVYQEFISAGSEGSALKVQAQGGSWNKTTLCLKVFPKENVGHASRETKVYRALQVAASKPENQQESTRILRYYYTFKYKDQYCIVLEYCKKTLTQYLVDTKDTMIRSEIQTLCREVCEGVQYLHKQGFAHRDIKPDNILVVDGHIRIGDMGAAIAAGSQSVLTGHNGTKGYSAPENTAAAGCTYTIAVDYFSLGATLHFIIAGDGFAQSPSEMARTGRQENENLISFKDWPNAKTLVDGLIHATPPRRYSPTNALKHAFFQETHPGPTQMPQPQSSSAQPLAAPKGKGVVGRESTIATGEQGQGECKGKGVAGRESTIATGEQGQGESQGKTGKAQAGEQPMAGEATSE